MALRSLATEIMFRDKATQAIQGVDSEIDGVRDNVEGVQDNFEDLGYETGEVSYSMQGDLQDVGSATGELEHQTGGFRDTMGRVGDSVKRNWQMVAGGIGAAGVALEGLIRKQADLERATSQVAIAMGGTDEEVRDMIGSMTDYTFSTEDALQGARRLQQSHIDEKSEIEELLPVFDEFADALQIDIVEGIDLADYALSRMDEDLQDFSEHADELTYVVHGTTLGLSEIERASRYVGDEFREADMGTQDLLTAMTALHQEGYRGRDIHEQLRDALSDAEDSEQDFWQTLNVTEESLEAANQGLEGSTGLMAELAEANNEQITTMERMQSRLEENIYGYSGLISELDVLSAGMSSMLPILGAAAGAKYLLGAAALATGGVVVAAIGGIVGAGWLLYDNWGTISQYFGDVWERATQRVDENMETIRALPGEAKAWGQDIIQGLTDGIDSGIDWLKGTVEGVRDTIVGGITDFFGISSPSTLMMEYGGNMGEGLHLGMEEKTEGFFRRAGQMFSPDRGMAPAGGATVGIGDIHVYSRSDNPREVAQEVKRTLRREFPTEANRYFGRQRRRR